MLNNVSKDSILDGKVLLLQPQDGYRVAIDTIILASLVHPKKDQKILDVGCGVGAVSVIVKKKELSINVTSIDIDADMCDLCMQNSIINNIELNVVNCSVKDDNNDLIQNGTFCHVITNPPFFENKSSRVSQTKRMANFETIALKDWIAFCIKKLTHNGTFSIIHNASRIDEILCHLHGSVGAIEIIPIYSKVTSEAKRVFVRAKKCSGQSTKILPGLIVHEAGGEYTQEMKNLLSGNFLKPNK